MANRRVPLRLRRPGRERLLVIVIEKKQGVPDLQATLRRVQIPTVVVLVQVFQHTPVRLVGPPGRHRDRDEPGLHRLHQGELADDPRNQRLFRLDLGPSRLMRVARIDEDRGRGEVDNLGHPEVPVVVQLVNRLHPDALVGPAAAGGLGVDRPLPAVVSFVVQHDYSVAVPGAGPTKDAGPHLLVRLGRLRLIDTSPSEGLATPPGCLKTSEGGVPAGLELLEVENRDVHLGQPTPQAERQQSMLVVEVVVPTRIETAKLPGDRSPRRDDDDATDVPGQPEAVVPMLRPAVYSVPGDQHRHHGRLAGPRRHADREPGQATAPLLAERLETLDDTVPAVADFAQVDDRLHGLALGVERAVERALARRAGPVLEELPGVLGGARPMAVTPSPDLGTETVDDPGSREVARRARSPRIAPLDSGRPRMDTAHSGRRGRHGHHQ